ncbi:hypothetical protein CBS101457_004100 [Exobasidium rhododendri]|nr:hypothetical protein CBS101457_004100 [Exobasidium rhododendri]
MTSRPGGDDNLRDSLLKSRISKLPHLPAIAPSQWSSDSVEERDEGDGLGALSMAPPPRSTPQRSAESRTLDLQYTPLSADDCFGEALEVEVDNDQDDEGDELKKEESEIQHTSPSKPRRQNDTKNTFRVYYTPPKQLAYRSKGKAGSRGVSQLDSLESLKALEVDEMDDSSEADSGTSPGTIFFLHHGAGYSALSFALVAKHVTKETQGEAGVLAFDCRGHGRTKQSSVEQSQDMSLSTLTKDSMAILSKLFPSSKPQPTLILVGHSMGGSVVVSLCHALSAASKTRPVPRVAGVAVLDVVEGTAMSSLSIMKNIVSALPKGFNSVEEAIRWHIDSGTIVNAQSARRSVPSLLEKSNDSQFLQTHANPSEENLDSGDDTGEAVEELRSTSPSQASTGSISSSLFAYKWRANLLATEPYWSGWFEGLSQSFLSVKCARLLLLAGTDRLDKDLMIGQMQGKYQLVVFADVGHSLQEDAPQRTAQTLIEFWKRNESLDVTKFRGNLKRVGDT